jgi:circadian clock protein KaiB
VGSEPRFRVFVAGASWRSQRVVRALRDLCQVHGVSGYAVEVVDVTQDPEAADLHRILALPVVMRVDPEPVVRVVGDLSDARVAADVLGLSSVVAPDHEGTEPGGDVAPPPGEDR